MGYTHPMKYYLAIQKNEALRRATTWMSLENMGPNERHKRHVVNDSQYLKHPEQAKQSMETVTRLRTEGWRV